MKKTLLYILVGLVPLLSHAQSGLLNKVKNKINSRIDKRVDEKIDKTLDDIESKTKPEKETSKADTAESPSSSGIKSYAKFDFVPGEEIIYANDFATDEPGELPIGWNSNGNGAVVTLNNIPGKWAQLYQDAAYITDNKDSLTQNFTLEFDLVLKRSNPNASFPMLAFGVLSSGDSDPTANKLLKDYTAVFATELKIQPAGYNGSHFHLHTYSKSGVFLSTDVKKFGQLENFFNKVIHIAMQVQKERLRIWLDETKIYDLPKAIVSGTIINQLYFLVKHSSYSDEEAGYAIGNIKIAKGQPDTRHRLIDEGRFSTTGIQFDLNSAAIKSESYPVVKDIADVLKKYPETKIRIIGHTDSDGNDKTNLELSLKRADAVKAMLVKDFNLGEDRLETEGKGETEPVSDNTSKEGKARNRRVEFVKI